MDLREKKHKFWYPARKQIRIISLFFGMICGPYFSGAVERQEAPANVTGTCVASVSALSSNGGEDLAGQLASLNSDLQIAVAELRSAIRNKEEIEEAVGHSKQFIKTVEQFVTQKIRGNHKGLKEEIAVSVVKLLENMGDLQVFMGDLSAAYTSYSLGREINISPSNFAFYRVRTKFLVVELAEVKDSMSYSEFQREARTLSAKMEKDHQYTEGTQLVIVLGILESLGRGNPRLQNTLDQGLKRKAMDLNSTWIEWLMSVSLLRKDRKIKSVAKIFLEERIQSIVEAFRKVGAGNLVAGLEQTYADHFNNKEEWIPFSSQIKDSKADVLDAHGLLKTAIVRREPIEEVESYAKETIQELNQLVKRLSDLESQSVADFYYWIRPDDFFIFAGMLEKKGDLHLLLGDLSAAYESYERGLSFVPSDEMIFFSMHTKKLLLEFATDKVKEYPFKPRVIELRNQLSRSPEFRDDPMQSQMLGHLESLLGNREEAYLADRKLVSASFPTRDVLQWLSVVAILLNSPEEREAKKFFEERISSIEKAISASGVSPATVYDRGPFEDYLKKK